jgi:enoyl-CoA hydratase/carnithine racemase
MDYIKTITYENFKDRKLSLKTILELFGKLNLPRLNEYKYIIVEDKKQLKLVSFNNKENLNSASLDSMIEVNDLNFDIRQNKDFYIFKGDKSNKVFSTGADLKLLYLNRDNREYLLLYLLFSYYSTYISHTYYRFNTLFIWNGFTIGGGLTFGILSKYRVATESTVIAMPESLFDFIPNVAYCFWISKFLSLKEALYFSLFGHRFVGYEAFIKQFANFYILNKDIDNLLSDLSQLESLSDENIIGALNKYHCNAVGSAEETDLKAFDEIIAKVFNFEINVNDFESFYVALVNKLKDYDDKLHVKFMRKKKETVYNCFYITFLSYDKSQSYENLFDKDIELCWKLMSEGIMTDGIKRYFLKETKPKF